MKGMVISGIVAALGFSQTATADSLRQAVDADHRTPAYVERDAFRHPYETLQFFGLTPDMTVVELWPGGGWYSEILAPYLKQGGKLYAAHFDPNSEVGYFRNSLQRYQQKLDEKPQIYSDVSTTVFDPPQQLDIAPAGSADAVLTFRNVHNWYMRGGGSERLDAAFAAMYTALKPGGILGIVDHRLPASRPLNEQDKSGYMREDFVIETATKAGFQLVARSEINANPLDLADHPKGVWTLPPALRGPKEDMHKYLSIGESDRMTLKFIKAR